MPVKPDGKWQHMSLTIVEQIVYERDNEAVDFSEHPKAAVSPLARLVAIPELDTENTRLLAEVVKDKQGEIVLTDDELAAYQRLAKTMNAAITDRDPLHRLWF